MLLGLHEVNDAEDRNRVQIEFSCHKGYSTGQNVLVMLAHIQNISPFCDRVTLTLCVAHGDRYL